jgi:antitoxin MazE
MKTRIVDRNGELFLAIPPEVASRAAVKPECEVEVKAENGSIVVRPVTSAGYSLQDLLSRVTEENIHSETDWGRGVAVS